MFFRTTVMCLIVSALGCGPASAGMVWSDEFNGSVIDNLLKSTIIKATKELNKPWCLSVFEDNAGVIDFDGDQALAFKVETHNHPSAIEPFGGAATGLGGVISLPFSTMKIFSPLPSAT